MSFSYGENTKGRWSFSSSQTFNAFLNLAWENELLQGKFVGDSHLFIYRNSACIVSGRFQVPWKEMNFLNPHAFPYVRRRSGGGTVYHDLGNWNFCFIHRGRDLKREQNLDKVIQIVAGLGLELSRNERFDLTTIREGKVYKVSGSAFKQKKDMALHHGTLLVKAELQGLKGALGTTTGWHITGKGIASVPSPVCNLEKLDYEDWQKAWCDHLNISNFKNIEAEDSLLSEAQELESWQWRFGETPRHWIEFTNFGVSLEIHKGQVVDQLGLSNEINVIGKKVCHDSLADFDAFWADLVPGISSEVQKEAFKESLLGLFEHKPSISFN